MKPYLFSLLLLGAAPMSALAQDYCIAGDPPVDVAYPSAAVEKRATGVVIMKSLLGEDGIPETVSLLASSGDPDLDAAAMAAAKASPIACTAGYAGDEYIDAIAFDIESKRNNRRILASTQVTRVIEPLAVGLANMKRLANQCHFKFDDKLFMYPQDAISGHVEGTLNLDVSVDPVTHRRQVTVVDSSGDTRLDTVASRLATEGQLECGANAPTTFRIPVRFLMNKASIKTVEEAGANRITHYTYVIKPGHLIWSRMDAANAAAAK